MTKPLANLTALGPYETNAQHLAEELGLLDLLIAKRVRAIRADQNELREITVDPHLYVSDAEVDHLLADTQTDTSTDRPTDRSTDTPTGTRRDTTDLNVEIAARRAMIDNRLAASKAGGMFPLLPQLAGMFGLTPLEVQILVIAIAPELRRKYDKLYVYLQDDIGRKKPGIDMVLDLLGRDEREKWELLGLMTEDARLLRAGLLQTMDDPQNPSGSSHLSRFLKPDRRIIDFLLGHNRIHHGLTQSGAARLIEPTVPMDDLLVDEEVKAQVMNVVTGHNETTEGEKRKLAIHLQGPAGVGKQALVESIAMSLSCHLLVLDMGVIRVSGVDARRLLWLAFREGLLQQALIYIDAAEPRDTSRDTEGDSELAALLKSATDFHRQYGWITILGGEANMRLDSLFPGSVFYHCRLEIPAVELRQRAWDTALARELPDSPGEWAGELAQRFRLTATQVDNAVCEARYTYGMGKGERVTERHLSAAARNQSTGKLGELAKKITPKYGWDDIVLPGEKTGQLKEICNHVAFRHRVFMDWGFDAKLSYGKGLSVLFAGPPGTGKTMAAEVIAHELQLDLYKIDLSGVVSKYIGETEKNLSRIFSEAEASNAILFFDEADALFGKRTDVSDSHDRYANIETSYLLQKMESYEGIVILATNLLRNMDDAFLRRLRFVVDFVFPDAAGRLRIWRGHFPAAAPLGDDINFEHIAERLQVAGGNIKNIVLAAAFHAACDGGVIGMSHIMRGARREYDKIGKLWNESYMEVPNAPN